MWRDSLANVPDEGVWVNLDRWIRSGQHREADTAKDMGSGEKTSLARAKPALEAMVRLRIYTGRKREQRRTHHAQNRRRKRNEDGERLGTADASSCKVSVTVSEQRQRKARELAASQTRHEAHQRAYGGDEAANRQARTRQRRRAQIEASGLGFEAAAS
jgi:hypothetical protein